MSIIKQGNFDQYEFVEVNDFTEADNLFNSEIDSWNHYNDFMEHDLSIHYVNSKFNRVFLIVHFTPTDYMTLYSSLIGGGVPAPSKEPKKDNEHILNYDEVTLSLDKLIQASIIGIRMNRARIDSLTNKMHAIHAPQSDPDQEWEQNCAALAIAKELAEAGKDYAVLEDTYRALKECKRRSMVSINTNKKGE